MNPTFLKCPKCCRAISKADIKKQHHKRYGDDVAPCDALPIPCVHCGHSAYQIEFKKHYEEKRLTVRDDLFRI